MKRIREKPPARKRRNKNSTRAMKRTREKPPAPNDLDHINEIIKNARATWFVLLGALVFAAVTLAGIKDVAFLVPDLETQLPLAGISVPVMSFFWAGALLVAVLYIYFHLYLEKLWQALGEADAEINGKLLADQIHPWLVSDSALRMRDWLRKTEDISTTGDSRGRRFIKRCLNRLSGRLQSETTEPPCSRSRGMSWISGIVSFSLVWLFGLVVIFWFWWRSMPAHELYLTGWLGLVLAATLGVFLQSALGSLRWLAASDWSPKWRLVYSVFLICIIGLTIVRSSWDPWAGEPRRNLIAPEKCTMEEIGAGEEIASGDIFWCRLNFRALLDPLRPARANLQGVVFTRKPEGWLGKEIEKAEYRAKWCNQHGELACRYALDPAQTEQTKFAEAEGEEEERFESAWKIYWNARLSTFEKPDLRTKDLRGADLTGVRLEGADLTGVRLEGADLTGVRLEGADLTGVRLEGADLTGVNLTGANLTDARLEGKNLSSARLKGANLRGAQLEGADLRGAQLEGAKNLSSARLKGANLTDADLRA